jgi:hypothetical protein
MICSQQKIKTNATENKNYLKKIRAISYDK